MSRLKFARSASVLASIIMAAALSQAQGSHTLQGKVSFPSGVAPPNSIKVTLTYNGRRVYETFTDLSGRFSFTGLGRGTYQLTAEGDGQTFETTTVYAEVAAYSVGSQTFTQNIQLRMKSGKAVAPGGVVSAEALDASIPEVARKEYQKGVKRAGDNKPEQAIKHFQDAILAHPDFYLAYTAMGEQYAKLKRYEEAIAAYQKAISLKADRADAHVGLGVTFVKQQKYVEALVPLRRSIELEKLSPTSYLFLGLAEMMTGDYGSAETNLLRAYEMGKPAIAHIYLANLYDLKGEPAKAIKHLQSFLKENPNLPEARQIEIREVIEKLRKRMAGK